MHNWAFLRVAMSCCTLLAPKFAEGQGESVRLVFDIQNERESGNNLLQQLGNQSCWKAHVLMGSGAELLSVHTLCLTRNHSENKSLKIIMRKVWKLELDCVFHS